MHIQNLLQEEIKPSKRLRSLKLKVIEGFQFKSKTKYLDKFFEHYLNMFLLLTSSFVVIFLLRLVSLQIFDFGKYHTLSLNNFLRREIIYANRGLIFDRNGELLVRNIPNYIISQNVSLCYTRSSNSYDKCSDDLSKLSGLLQFDRESVVKKYAPDKIIVLKKYLSKDEIDNIYLKLSEMKSIQVSILPIRSYTYPESFSHVLGYVSESDEHNGEFEGKDGIELFYNNVLSGVSGNQISKVDAFNNKIDTYSEISPIPGKDIVLTIDSRLQNYAYELLSKAVANKGQGGSVVVQNPRTGEVLALASFPGFDLNQFSFGLTNSEYQKLLNDPRKVFFNRSISGLYPPGSVFKLLTASAILEEGVASPRDTIFDRGFIQIGNSRYNNWKLDGHGEVDLTRAIVVSNDTYFYIYSSGYQVPKKLGIEGIHKWADLFKLNELTGIDLPGERKGFVPSGKEKEWFLGDTFISSIGQGDVLSTPIQMSVLSSYFGANQKAYQPYLVKSIDNLERQPKILYSDLLKEPNFLVVKEALRKTNLPGGTAYPFFDFKDRQGFYSGGKTGTSEFMTEKGMLTHAWYVVFAPYEEAEVSIAVFLEGGGGGSGDAAPIARKLMDFYFSLPNQPLN